MRPDASATAGPARIGLFVGKGGVGKSTLAAATAVAAARAGRRVLLVSTDQAHSLGDVLGVAVPPTGRRDPVRVTIDETELSGGRLDALALDTLALLAARWREVVNVLAGRFPESDLGTVAPEELCALPGIQELLGLAEVAGLAATGQWDQVLVDCASTADALRMLTLPATVALYAERAWPRHRRLSPVDAARSTAIVDLVERVTGAAERLTALLTDDTLVSAHLVLTAERVVAAEAVRTLGSLALMGVRVEDLIVNQVLVQDGSYAYTDLPDHPAFDWYAERIHEQQLVLAELDTAIGDAALVLIPHLAGEPIGAKALGELLDSARRRDGSPPPGPLRPVVDREPGSAVGFGTRRATGSEIDAEIGAEIGVVYRLRLELPQVDPGSLNLGRSGDDLIVGVGGLRRRVRLASVLRRCIVSDAVLRGTELTVRFRPDPALWPR